MSDIVVGQFAECHEFSKMFQIRYISKLIIVIVMILILESVESDAESMSSDDGSYHTEEEPQSEDIESSEDEDDKEEDIDVGDDQDRFVIHYNRLACFNS